jgi:hypothetical protein
MEVIFMVFASYEGSREAFIALVAGWAVFIDFEASPTHNATISLAKMR